MADDEADDAYQFEVDEVGPDAGTEREPIEPGDPDVENALFVILGALGTLFVLFRLVFG